MHILWRTKMDISYLLSKNIDKAKTDPPELSLNQTSNQDSPLIYQDGPIWCKFTC